MKKYLLLYFMEDSSLSVLFFNKLNEARMYAIDNCFFGYAIYTLREFEVLNDKEA